MNLSSGCSRPVCSPRSGLWHGRFRVGPRLLTFQTLVGLLSAILLQTKRELRGSLLEDAATVRVEAAIAVATRWNQMGIQFLVMHGLEGYPGRIGRDLDTLMDQSLAEAALAGAATVLGRLGWQSVRPPDTTGKRLVALRSEGNGEFRYLELHTFGSLRWLLLPLVERYEAPSHTVGPFAVSDWATLMKSLVTPALAGDFTRLTPEYIDRHVRSGIRPETIDDRCRAYFGRDLGSDLIQGLEQRDPRQFVDNAVTLRRTLIEKMVKHPMVSLRETPGFLRRRVPRTGRPSGLRVLLRTAPTPQMEMLVDFLVSKLSSVFTVIDVRDSGSRRRSLKYELGLQARQALAIDHMVDLPLERAQVIASVVEFGSPPKSVELSLEDHSVSEVSSLLAEWILAAWTERMAIRHRR